MSGTIEIPVWVAAFMVGLSFSTLALVIVTEVYETIKNKRKEARDDR